MCHLRDVTHGGHFRLNIRIRVGWKLAAEASDPSSSFVVMAASSMPESLCVCFLHLLPSHLLKTFGKHDQGTYHAAYLEALISTCSVNVQMDRDKLATDSLPFSSSRERD